MFFRSLFKKQQEPYSFVFDIANGSVGVLLMHTPTDGSTPIVHCTARTFLQSETQQQDTRTAITHALDTVSAKAIEAFTRVAPSNPAIQVHAVLHAPWAATSTDTITVPLARPAKITTPLLREILGRAMQAEQVTDTTTIDRNILSLALNGYPVENPEGKEAQEVTVTVAKSVVHSALHDGIVDALSAHFGARPPLFTTLTTLLLEHATAVHEEPFSTIVDIGAHHTAFTVIRDKHIIDTHVAAFGYKQFEETFAGVYNDTTQTKAQLQLYFTETATPSQARKIEDALLQQEPAFTQHFGDACTALVQKMGRLPHAALVITSTPLAPWLLRVIEKIDFAQFTTTSRPFSPEQLNATTLLQHADGVRPDALLSIAATFAVVEK